MSKVEQNSPPAGTGHAPGLGEAFSVNLSTGQGTYSYRMPMPAGVANHTPNLVLEYVHGAGHGPWGLGFRLPLRSITRRLDFGAPDDGLVERFLDGDAELMLAADGSHRAQRETSFARYTRVGDGWRIEERNGVVHELGLAPASRVAPPDHADRPIQWLLERSVDVSGNAIEYTYEFDQGVAYPATIRYAAYELCFHYEARPDVRHDGRAGFSRRRARRCSRLSLVLDPGADERVIRDYEFDYETASGSAVSLLRRIRLTARGAAFDGSLDVKRPSIEFRYSSFDPQRFHLRFVEPEGSAPPSLDAEDVALVTLDEAPLPGILLHQNGKEHYWANRGGARWTAPKPLSRAPLASALAREGLAFVDMDGSGTADLMVANADGLQGYYENGGSQGFRRFVAFPHGTRATPDWTDANLRLFDADGDGLVDAVLSQKRAFVWWQNQGQKGWSSPKLAPKNEAELLDVDFSDPDVQLADMSGDGLLDIVRIRSGAVEYWPSLGRGRFGAKVTMRNSPRLRRDVNRDTLILVDLDGDGCAELVQVSAQGLIIYQNQNGTRFADPIVINTVPPPFPGTVRAVNLEGRAAAGLIWNSPRARGRAYVEFEFASNEPPYLLSTIDNGAGLLSEISYRSAVEDFERDRDAGVKWTTNFPFPYLVVAGTRETDAVSGRQIVVDLLYHEAHFEATTRQFQGFRRAERIERGDVSRPDTRQVHQFLMAEERRPGHGPEHAALNGLLSRVETYQLDGGSLEHLPLRVEISEYALSVLDTAADGRSRTFIAVSLHRREDSERSSDLRIEEHFYEYDANGNVVRERQRGSGTRDGVAEPELERVTEIAYAVSATRYLIDKPASVAVRSKSGELLSEKRLYYDGPDFMGLALGQADRGLVTRELNWVLTQDDFDAHYAGMNEAELGFSSENNIDGVPSVFATARRHRYDARGLLRETLDALGNSSAFTFDPSGLFRVQLDDPLGSTVFEYDRATGQITRTTYADGAVTLFAYDAQGRILRTALPGQDIDDPPVIYAYDETSVPTKRTARMRQEGGGRSLGVTYFDGYGHEFQQRVEVESGRFLVSGLKLQNPWGDLREEFEPTFSASSAFALPATAGQVSRNNFYDAAGRVVRSVNFNGGISTAEYRAFAVVLRDANDNDGSAANRARGQFDTPHEEAFDVFRQLVRVTEHLGPARKVTTTYEIGPLGELSSVSDANGTKFRYGYDRRGNRLRIELRESGVRKIWYDARNSPVRTLDPAGHDLQATWDAIGRQKRLLVGSTVLEEYEYDTAAQNAHGRIAEVRHDGGSQRFSYDSAGRLSRREYFYDGVAAPQTLHYEYDPLGRETAVVHTDGTRIERQLFFNGWLRAISDVIQSIDYDPRGLPSAISYANGVRTSFDYTPGPGRIRHQTTTSASNSVLQQIEFVYDQHELLLSRNDTAPEASGMHEFGYDPLYQLTSSSSVENGSTVLRQYDYAADYNLRRFDEAKATLNYADPAHPDRLSGLTPDGGPTFAVDYDANGNLLHLPGQGFEYNAKNELARFTRADGLVAEYRYDHRGFRISKTLTEASGDVTRVLYVTDQAEVRDGVPTVFVTVGALRIAAIGGETIRFLHDDGTASTNLVTDATGERVGSVESRPFGNVAQDNGDTLFRVFALHPVDEESGLVYMRRRYYSPALGRFLTPDLMAIYQPETLLHVPQGLHLYAFVANDPLNKTDPTGLSFWSVVGAIVGVVAGVAAGLAIIAAVVATGGLAGIALGIGLVLVGGLAVTGVSYLIASNVDPNSGFGQFMRGFMIGFNAGMNGVIAGALFGPWVGVALGVVNFAAAFDGIAQSPVYQGILGWSSWLMPMSWAATGLGLAFYVVNLVVAGVTFQQWDAAKIDKLGIDWKTGTIVMEGGLIRTSTAFNMGNFVFINKSWADNPASFGYDAVLRHETGHTLNNAAFGFAFSISDMIGEKVAGAGADDYGEELAESHTVNRGRKTIPMWG